MIYAILAFAAVSIAAVSALAGLYARESKRFSDEVLRRGEAELAVARIENVLVKADEEVREAKALARREIMVRKRYYREIEQLEENARLVGDGAATARGLQRFLSKNKDSGEAESDSGPVP
ncbi:MAG: hypothetical protein ACYTFQ_18495, partial [Planctomycetota bacterium]